MADDALVIFMPSGRRGRVPFGTTVLDAARRIGADLDSVCGGRGICSKCQVAPGEGAFPKLGVTVTADALSPRNAVEDRYDRVRGLMSGRRLGCQAEIRGDVVLDVPAESQVHRQVVRKAADARAVAMDPAIRRCLVEVAEPDMHHPSGDLERLSAALKDEWGVTLDTPSPAVLARLQGVLRKGAWQATAILHQPVADGPVRLIDLRPGYFEGRLYGMAVDVGSTTIAAHLTDLATGAVVASAGRMNPQIRYGEDLMSRVSYAMMNPDGAARMTEAVRDALSGLATDLSAEADVAAADIVEATLVANPVMHHLVLGIDPVELGQAPFALALGEAVEMAARDLDWRGVADEARVYVLPCIAGHVGADAAAVALSEEPWRATDRVLIVDVGTNAEIQLGHPGGVLACSSPTGPAFEGAQISSGQRAAPGAVERVEIDPATQAARVRVIGQEMWSDEAGFDAAKVTGICGSGIIEAVAEMRTAGVLDPTGLIGSAEQTGTDRCVPDGRTHSYVLIDARDAGGPLVTVTQSDIRAIQLAKSALYAGARLLMDEIGAERVDRVVLAGAFGAHISPKHAMILGMIPDCRLDAVTSAGNAAGTGARIALCSRAARRTIETKVREIRKVETAIEPRFQEHFVAANAIPHAVDAFPELSKVIDLPDVAFGAAGKSGGRRRRRAEQMDG